jgi:hypothetical protein
MIWENGKVIKMDLIKEFRVGWRLCKVKTSTSYYKYQQKDLANSVYALTCSFSFYKENNHQMILSCPLCIA